MAKIEDVDHVRWVIRLLRLVRDNVIFVATLALAAYVIIRGEVLGYQQKQLPFLVALLIAVLGLNALDGLVERNTRSVQTSRALASLERGAADSRGELTAIDDRLVQLGLEIDGLHLGAVASQFLTEESEIPHDRFRRAQTIYWSGVTLRASLRQRLPDLNAALSRGASLCVLVIDPASQRLQEELTARERAKEEYILGVLKSMILNLQVLAEGLPVGESFKLGLHRLFPTYGLTILDPEDPDGICIVELYHPNRQACAMFILHATTDAAWFSFFVSQFRTLMSGCRIVDIWRPEDVETAVG